MDTGDSATPDVHFRPVKRQKFLRKRIEDDVEEAQSLSENTPLQASPMITPADSKSQHDPSSSHGDRVSNVVRLRQPQRVRRGGIEFSTQTKPKPESSSLAPMELSGEELENEGLRAKFDRFTAFTGQKVDVDKHMMEYIESELARRQKRNDAIQGVQEPQNTITRDHSASQPGSRPSQREPATLGKLHEIDLGQETKLQNIARTEAATRRLVGGENTGSEDDATSVKPREGMDGKPWRGRRRRNSDDIERDRLVEEVLRESKLEVYELEEDVQQDDQAADDRIAEQFRRDFMEAIQTRRRIAKPRTTKTAQVKSDAPRGPKLGGSRSARAAMREMQGKTTQK